MQRILLLAVLLVAGCASASLVVPAAMPPTAAVEPSRAPGSVSISARTFLTSGGWACALDDQRALFCWLLTSEEPSSIPHRDRRPTMTRVPGLGPIAALDGKEDYVCALEAAGSVHCWGCLLGGEVCKLWPERVALSEAARGIAVGVDGACALLASGSVSCWGSAEPSKVSDLQEVVQLSATALGRCARQRDGTISCWGDERSTPTRIAGLAQAHALASNRSYSCAITGPERQIQCWGLPEAERTHWQSALSRSAAALQALTTLEGLRNVRQLELGERFGVAVTDDGALYHWGAAHKGGIYAFDGESAPRDRPRYAHNLDTSVVEDLDLEPTRVGEQLHVKSARVTGYHVCLELEPGGLRCEPALESAPFHVEEVWPSVSFGVER
jgi:alpha-tubulin suppressor-like RCC1 family protein